MTKPKITIKEYNDNYETWSADNGDYSGSGLHAQGAYVDINGKLFPCSAFSELSEGDLSRFVNESGWTVDTSGKVFGSNSLAPTSNNYERIDLGYYNQGIDCIVRVHVHFVDDDSSEHLAAMEINASDAYYVGINQSDTSDSAKLNLYKQTDSGWTLLDQADTNINSNETTFILLGNIGTAALGIHGDPAGGRSRSAVWTTDIELTSSGWARFVADHAGERYYDNLIFDWGSDGTWASGDIDCTGIEYLEGSLSTWDVDQDKLEYFDGLESGSLDNNWTVYDSAWGVSTHAAYEGSYSVGVYPYAQPSSPCAKWDPGVQFPDMLELYWWETKTNSTGGGFYVHDKEGNFLFGVASDNPQWEIDGGSYSLEIKGDDDVYEEWVRVRVIFMWDIHVAWVIMDSPSSGLAHYPVHMQGYGTDIVGNGLGAIYFSSYSSGNWDNSYMEMLFDNITFNPGASVNFQAQHSTDGGSSWSSWQDLTKDGSIFSSGSDLTNTLLRLRVQMARNHPFVFPRVNYFQADLTGQLNALSINMQGDGFNVQGTDSTSMSSSMGVETFQPYRVEDSLALTSSLSAPMALPLTRDIRTPVLGAPLSVSTVLLSATDSLTRVASLSSNVVDKRDWVITSTSISCVVGTLVNLMGDWGRTPPKVQAWAHSGPQHGVWTQNEPVRDPWTREESTHNSWTRSGPEHDTWNKE